MEPVWSDSHGALWQGHVLDVLAAMEPESVQLCVTSPPYFALRAYGTEPQVWGNHNGCEHEFAATLRARQSGGDGTASAKQISNGGSQLAKQPWEVAICRRCGCWKGELGSESLHDCNGAFTGAKCGACFICHLVEVFEAVKRVLRPDGVVLCNLGDSYAGSGKGPSNSIQSVASQIGGRRNLAQCSSGQAPTVWQSTPPGLKAKDLVGIPWRFALAMQAAGWWLRSEITWCKAAPMPESVTDRPTSATEKIFMFTKSERYFWDAQAVRQPNAAGHVARFGQVEGYERPAGGKAPERDTAVDRSGGWAAEARLDGANLKNYWVLPPSSFPGAHFATFSPEIPRRAILAGSSERGACAACGAPWRRVSERVVSEPTRQHYAAAAAGALLHNHRGTVERPGGFYPESPTTTGWAPTCTCECPDTRPCVVLDCFSGSGTSVLVARQLGRYGVGIELSPEYCAMSIKRFGQMVLL